jgi:hypothetical protein
MICFSIGSGGAQASVLGPRFSRPEAIVEGSEPAKSSPVSPALPASASEVMPIPRRGESRADRIDYSDKKIKGSEGYHARRVRGFGFLVAGLLTWVALFLAIARFAPGPYAALFAAAVTAAIWFGWGLVNRVPRAMRERCRSMINGPGMPARVRCVGKVRRLARVLSQEPIVDRMFEPQVYRGTGAIKSTGRKQAAQIVIGIAVAAAVVVGQWYFFRQIGNVYLDFMIAVGAAMVIGGAMFPTYLRVVPGRIDVMECGWLGKQILSVKRIDLRTKPIIVDLNRQLVQVGEAADAPKIAFGAVWDNWGFAHAVLEAAVSTHTPPPLPDDALIG